MGGILENHKRLYAFFLSGWLKNDCYFLKGLTIADIIYLINLEGGFAASSFTFFSNTVDAKNLMRIARINIT